MLYVCMINVYHCWNGTSMKNSAKVIGKVNFIQFLSVFFSLVNVSSLFFYTPSYSIRKLNSNYDFVNQYTLKTPPHTDSPALFFMVKQLRFKDKSFLIFLDQIRSWICLMRHSSVLSYRILGALLSVLYIQLLNLLNLLR